MDQFKFNHNYVAFLGLVNLHLESRHQSPVEGKELSIVEKWFNSQSTHKVSYINAVTEIINERTTGK